MIAARDLGERILLMVSDEVLMEPVSHSAVRGASVGLSQNYIVKQLTSENRPAIESACMQNRDELVQQPNMSDVGRIGKTIDEGEALMSSSDLN